MEEIVHLLLYFSLDLHCANFTSISSHPSQAQKSFARACSLDRIISAAVQITNPADGHRISSSTSHGSDEIAALRTSFFSHTLCSAVCTLALVYLAIQLRHYKNACRIIMGQSLYCNMSIVSSSHTMRWILRHAMIFPYMSQDNAGHCLALYRLNAELLPGRSTIGTHCMCRSRRY